MEPLLFLSLKQFHCAVLSTIKLKKPCIMEIILCVLALWRTVSIGDLIDTQYNTACAAYMYIGSNIFVHS